MMGPFGGGPVPSCAGPSAGPLASSFVGCQAAFPIQSQQLHHRIQSTQRAMHYGKSASSPPNHPQAQFHTTPVAQLVFTSGPLRAIGCDVSAQVNGMLVCVAEATSVHNPIPLNDSASGMVAEEASGTGRACCSGVRCVLLGQFNPNAPLACCGLPGHCASHCTHVYLSSLRRVHQWRSMSRIFCVSGAVCSRTKCPRST